MSFVPDDELRERTGFSMAPMIDFLFLMLAMFASLAVTRIAMKETEIDLVKVTSPSTAATKRPREQTSETKIIHVSVSEEGNYKWITEVRDHPIETAEGIGQELVRQYQKGLLPEDKLKTHVLLKIDKKAKWEPILKVILSIRDAGFDVFPVYEPSA